MKLAGKVAIVGGASRGIGKDMALALAAEGAKIVVVARSEVEPDPRLPGTIHQTVAEIQAAGGDAMAVKADISDEAQVETMAKSALEAYGRIDILINNAAVLVPRGILDLPTRHIDLHNRVNIKGPILCIRAVLPPCCSNSRGGSSMSPHALRCSPAQGLTRMSPRHAPLCMLPPKRLSNVSPRGWPWSIKTRASVLTCSPRSGESARQGTSLA